MRAVTNNADLAEPIRFDEVAEPVPAADEALVAVRGFSVNRGELALLAARPAGWRPGQDIAGVVLEPAADGSGPAAGTRVVGIVEGAGWAQSAAVPTSRLAALSDPVTMEQAAGIPMAGLTALRTVRLGAGVLGRAVLVTGANGGVGRFQVQLAALSGAQVSAATSRAAEVGKELTGLGATHVVPDADAADGPFDLVLDSVGGPSLAAAIARLAPGGLVVVLGNSSGQPTPVSVYDFFGHEGARLQNYMSYAAGGDDAADLALLVELAAGGRLSAEPGHVADWADLPGVIKQMRDRALPGGKVVLTIG